MSKNLSKKSTSTCNENNIVITTRIKRLQRELQEINKCPIGNIVCQPVGDCLDEWHGNVRGVSGGEWEDVVVHFTVTFPVGYPHFPPRVTLSSFIPHMNVIRRSGKWEVCLDMLETQPIGVVTIPYRYWSSAFSVRSILVQMSSFILADDQPYETSQGNMTTAMEEARNFVCQHMECSHCWKSISPSFPLPSIVESAPLCFPSVQVSGEEAELLLNRIYRRRLAEQDRLIKEAQEKEMKDKVTEELEEKKDEGSQVQLETEPVVQKKEVLPTWTTVKGKGKRLLNTSEFIKLKPQKYDEEDIGVDNMYKLLNGDFILASKLLCSQCSKNCKVSTSYSKSQLAKGENRRCNACLAFQKTSSDGKSPTSILSTNTSAADKNFARRERKRQRAKQSTPPPTMNSLSSLPFVKLSFEEKTTEKKSNDAVESDEKAADNSSPPTENGNTNESEGEWKRGWRAAGAVSVKTDANMSHFALLSRDSALCVLDFLNVNDILAVGTTCRGAADMIDDWVLWKRLLCRYFPRSALEPKGTSTTSWKHAFILEANHLSSELRCFHTLATKDDGDVLAMPLEYTINPKTNEMDYATSNFDVISLAAYNDESVRRSTWGEKFTTILPYYLDETHFEKSLKILHKVARRIIGPSSVTPREMEEWKAAMAVADEKKRKYDHGNFNCNGRFPKNLKAWTPCNEPEMILTLISRMMNTQVVLLSDKGIEASENALTGYCQLHRLGLAVVDKYPQLRVLIRKRLDDFVRRPESRVKSKTPSLGELMIYISMNDTYSWPQVSMPYLLESFDRSVLWSCSKDSSLATVTTGDMTRLDKYLVTQKVAMRLTLFHSTFLRLLVKNGGSLTKLEDCKDRYDAFQGRPPKHLRTEFHNSIRNILAFDNWPQFFQLAGIPLPSKPQLLSVLEKAVGNSRRKGYHSDNTDFSRLMSSGVSKILLKGESYTAAPNLKRLQLRERWRYDGDVIFLDASCLVFSFHGTQVGEPVDYAHTYWGNGCIRHSGDIVYDGQGEHTIDIDIARIPSNVKAMFFTVSAWTTTLRDISQPSCHLHDLDSDTEMCRYMHEGVNTRDYTAVIMCKLHRFSPSSRWELTIVGSTGYGRAGNYSPLINDIKKLL